MPLTKFSNACQVTVWLWLLATVTSAQEQNLNSIANRLIVPEVVEGVPAPGKRVWQRLEPYRDGTVAHAIYLPTDWQAGKSYPVIFEYPGNGGFKNALGDTSAGTVEGCRLGYGIAEGKQAIWVCLPFVDRERRQHSVNWWGDAEETVSYCKQAVEVVCKQWGGDRKRLILCGFSRGAIATSYIGLRDDEIAGLWCGLIAHSHYDGVRAWPYADSDRESAIRRLKRFHDQPQWISHEVSVEKTRQFLSETGLLHDHIHLVNLPYPNHSPDWLLKDLPQADELRTWWRQLIEKAPLSK